jgi:hypothetical protein
MRPGHEADHSSSSITEVENSGELALLSSSAPGKAEGSFTRTKVAGFVS